MFLLRLPLTKNIILGGITMPLPFYKQYLMNNLDTNTKGCKNNLYNEMKRACKGLIVQMENGGPSTMFGTIEKKDNYKNEKSL